MVALHESTEKIEKQCNDKIAALNGQISAAQSELDGINAELDQKLLALEEVQQNLDSISQRKESIIQDFQVVKDVLGLSGGGQSAATNASAKVNIAELSLSDNRLPFYKGYENNLEKCLELYQITGVSLTELANQHAAYKVMLLPKMELAMSLVAAAGKSFYHIAYASVAWKSFDDVWKSGLSQIIGHCAEQPDVLHYFVLRNINLSCL